MTIGNTGEPEEGEEGEGGVGKERGGEGGEMYVRMGNEWKQMEGRGRRNG